MGTIQRFRGAALVFLTILIATTSPQETPFAQTSHPIADAEGLKPNRAFVGDLPFERIDTLTGNVILTFTDIVLPGYGTMDVAIQRTYNSKTRSWRFGIAGIPTRIFRANGPAGRPIDILPQPHSGEVPNLVRFFPVVLTADGGEHVAYSQTQITWTSTLRHFVTKEQWKYDAHARLLELPNGLRCSYDTDGRLTEVRDPFSNWLEVAWNQFELATITQHLGDGFSRTATFSPNHIEVDGRVWTYNENGGGSMRPPAGPGSAVEYSGGELSAYVLPGGGRVEYDHSARHWTDPRTGGGFVSKVVTDRRVAVDGVTAGSWIFRYPDVLGGRTTVSGPFGIVQHFDYFESPSGGDFVLGMIDTFDEQGVRETQETQYRILGVMPFSDAVRDAPQRRTTNRNGRTYVTTLHYGVYPADPYFRLASVEEAGELSRTRTLTYDDSFSHYFLNRVKSETVTIGTQSLVRSWEYADDTGAVESETIHGVTRTFATDSGTGAVTAATDAHNHTTGFTHKAGVVKNTITPKYTIERDINPDGTTALERRGGFVTNFEYDAAGRLVWTKPPAGHWTQTIYDPQGRWVRIQRSGGGRTEHRTVHFDGFGRPAGSSTAMGISTRILYDALGRKSYESGPFDGSRPEHGTAFFYDALDRLTFTRDTSDNSKVRYAYSDGVDVRITDQENRETYQNWDAFGDPSDARLVSVTDARGETFSYTYHVSGQLESVGQPGGTQRVWEYWDGTTLLKRESHPESGETFYTYEGDRLATKRDARGSIFAYGYDDNDRLKKITAGAEGAHTVTFDYDDSDNRTLVENDTVKSIFAFDAGNRLYDRRDTWRGGEPDLQTRYWPDDWDRVGRITYPSGTEVAYGYDLDGRVTEIQRGTEWLARVGAYHPSGAVKELTYRNGLVDRFDEDDRGRLKAINPAGGGGPLQVTYTYDYVGNVRFVDDGRSGFDQQLDYDELDRLKKITGFAANAYTYDALGNRKGQESPGLTFDYNYSTNRLETVSGFAQHPAVGHYEFDYAGNLRIDPAGEYEYTPFNMMERATIALAGGGTTQAFYEYDGTGIRKVRSTAQGTFTYLHGPADVLLAEYKSSSSGPELRREYYYLGARLVASTEPEAIPDPPLTVRLTSPLNNHRWANDEGIPLAADAATTEPGDSIAKVEFLRDGFSIGESTTPPYQLDWTPNLPPGTYLLIARAITALGKSAASAPVSVIVFAPGRVSGITVSPNPPAVGQLATVTVSGNSNPCGAVGIDFGDGRWEVLPHLPYALPLSEQPFVMTHRWTEGGFKRIVAAGHANCRGQVSLDINVLGPSATLTAPAAGSTYVRPAAITMTADATDSFGQPISRVDFYANGTLLGSDAAPPYALNWTSTEIGTFTLVAKAVTAQNVAGTSAPVIVQVVPPPLLLSVNPESPEATISAQIRIEALAGCDTITVTFGDGRSDTFLGVSGQPILGRYAWPTSGPKLVRAKGQGAACPSVGETKITVQPPPPFAVTVTPESPMVGGPADVKVTGPGPCTTVNVDFGEGVPATLMGGDGPPLIQSRTWTTPGVKTVTATGLGGACAFTATTEVTVQPPPLPLSIGVTPTSPFAASVAQVTIGAPSACTAVSVNFGDGTSQTFNKGSGWPVTQAHTWAASGARTITATGVSGTCPAPVSAPVTIQPPAPPPLTIAVSPASPGAGMPAQVTINGPAACTTVNVDYGDGSQQTFMRGSGPPITNAHTWTTPGPKAITAQGLGDQCNLPASKAITVLAPPTVSLTAPAPGASFMAPATLNLAASATAAQGTITKVEFYGNGALLGADTSSPYTFTWAAVPAGTYALVAKATDSNGVVGSSSAVNVVVGTPPPSTVLDVTISPNPVAAGVAATITVSGTNPCSMLWMDFGDGAWWIAPIGSLPFTTTHTWASGGSYTVLAKGFLDCGGEVTRTVNVSSAPTSAYEDAPSQPDHLSMVLIPWDLEDDDRSIESALTERVDRSDAFSDHSEPPQATATLTLILEGTGSGTVTSSPAGLTCTGGFGSTCTGTFPVGTAVTLTQSATAGHRFVGWGGSCTGDDACVIPLTANRFVVARFSDVVEFVTQFYHLDAIGSVRATTDAQGQVVDRFDYGPFGEGVGVTPDKSPLRFAGKTRDLESSLDYFEARYFASHSGRFTSADPAMDPARNTAEPQLWNRYAYVTNNPLRYVDPDGRQREILDHDIRELLAGRITRDEYNARIQARGAGVVAGVAIAATPFTWRMAVGCILQVRCQSVVIDVLEGAAGGAGRSHVGKAREHLVAELAGGTVANDFRIVVPNIGSSAVDVFGAAGEFIGVGGPRKGFNLGAFGHKLRILSEAARNAGVKAQYYLEEGTSEEAIRLAEKWLGKENVFMFRREGQ